MYPMLQIELPVSSFAVRMRPFFVASLFLLMGIVVGKFVIYDYWGAVSLVFVVLMGVFVLHGDRGINPTNALFYSVMAMVSGIFDVISCMLYFQHSKYKLFEDRTPTLALVAQVIFIISPIALFISAAISYSIFSDCRNEVEELLPMQDDFGPLGYGGPGGGGYQGPPAGRPQQNRGGPAGAREPNRFVPFQGQGRSLSSQ